MSGKQITLERSYLEMTYKATSYFQRLGLLFNRVLSPNGLERWNNGKKKEVKAEFHPLWTFFCAQFDFDATNEKNEDGANPLSKATALGNATKCFRASYLTDNPEIANITTPANMSERDAFSIAVAFQMYLDGRSISESNVEREIRKLQKSGVSTLDTLAKSQAESAA